MDKTLIICRALHFAATIQMTGVLLFYTYILRGLKSSDLLERRLRLIFWISLALALASGASWYLAVAASIDDASWVTAIADGTALTVLTGTQFGSVWLARLAIGILVAAVIMFSKADSAVARFLQLTAALIFVGSLAFAGHAASTPGINGDAHLAADIVHLVAVSAWLGGLLPYALYLSTLGRENSQASIGDIREVTRRFSNIGIAAVLAIVATGIINTLNLVASTELLLLTDYGRLLSLKLAIFAAMLMIASINRYVLTPRLPAPRTVAAISRNAMIEAALGLLVLGIVAALGTLPPAFLDHSTMQH